MGFLWNPGKEDQCLKIKQLKTSFSLLRIKIPENPTEGESYSSLFGNEIAFLFRNMNRTRGSGGFDHGICHPSSCSAQDSIKLLNHYFKHRVDFSFKNANRSIKHPSNSIQIFAVTFLCGILLLNLSSTLKWNGLTFIPFGPRSFDMVFNMKSVFRVFEKKSKEVDAMNDTRLINGMKSLYLFISIMVHTPVTMSVELGPMYNTVYSYAKYSPAILFLIRFAVDGVAWNVLMTAAVSVFSWSPHLESVKGKLSLKTLILVRFLRLFPIVLVTLLIIIAAPLIQFTNSGIIFNPVVQRMSENCQVNGWREVTFIENWVPAADMCLTVGWFLSADFQLNIIFFPLLITLFHDLKRGIKLAFAYVAVGMLIELYILYAMYDGYVSSSFENLHSFENLGVHHFWTTNWVPAYAIGLVVGTLIYKRIRIPETLHSNWRTVFVLTSVTALLTVVYATQKINYWEFSHFKLVTAAVTRATSPLLLAPVLYYAWMSFPSNIFRRMLTSPIHDFISKVLLPSYLAHLVLIVWATTYTRSESLDISPIILKLLGMGIFFFPISVICGLILHVMVEIPFMKLLKSLFTNK